MSSENYEELLQSVQSLDAETIEKTKTECAANATRERDATAIEAIIDGMKQGNHKRTDLVKFAIDKNNYAIPRQKVLDVLDRYTGEKLSNSCLWRVENCQTAKLYYILRRCFNSVDVG